MFASATSLQVSYIFIDGGCLQHVVKSFSDRFVDGRRLQLAWHAIRPHHRKAYYYDAIPVQLLNEDDAVYAERIAPKIGELKQIERVPLFHVRTGHVRRRGKRGNEQKMVDVQLAVDALSMASKGLFGSVTILTGDLDFKPLIDALVEMGVQVQLLYPVGETNDELLASADLADAITMNHVCSWFEPDSGAPSSRLYHQSELGDLGPITLVEWQSEAQGRSALVRRPDERFEVVFNLDSFDTEQRVVWRAASAEGLRRYLGECCGIEVPPLE